ncbi:MAG: Uma2 family endonuclease [Chloroflexota bacterium]
MALPQTERPITEAEMLAILSQDRYSHMEIRDGRWVGGEEPPMTGEEHGAIQAEMMFMLMTYLRKNKLGRIYPADLIYVLSGDDASVRVTRKPDISFVKQENLRTEDSEKPYYRAPDLAVEIVSPSESIEDTRAKINDYLTYGTQQVWVVYPKTKQVEIYIPDATSRTYNADDTISGGDLLPGLNLAVADIFDV